MENKITPSNAGRVASVRGSVVDVRFDAHLPPIYSVLRAGAKKEIVIEVLAVSGTPMKHKMKAAVVVQFGKPLELHEWNIPTHGDYKAVMEI
jgi:F0F1-type ATP synthase beta subunit